MSAIDRRLNDGPLYPVENPFRSTVAFQNHFNLQISFAFVRSGRFHLELEELKSDFTNVIVRNRHQCLLEFIG